MFKEISCGTLSERSKNMCAIIDFRKNVENLKAKHKPMSRIEAMVKGLVEIYTCNNCGGDIEVIDKVYPDCCPNCGAEILEWNDEDSNDNADIDDEVAGCIDSDNKDGRKDQIMSEPQRTSYSNYGKRNHDIVDFFREKGLEQTGKGGKRDIHFGNVLITDQVRTFAIYARGEDSEKTVFMKIFEKYNPIAGSVRRNPEPCNPRFCCARWNHSANDYEIMLGVVRDILSASGQPV
jgi:predicted RNA-binding Zn-ribbon protein involved in translation (DUF1610 family)